MTTSTPPSALASLHLEAMHLDDEAYALCTRLHQAKMHLLTTFLPVELNRPPLREIFLRLARAYDRAIARRKRRGTRVLALGMDARRMQELQTGDRVHWRGRMLRVVDWHCYREPIVASTGGRIWAEPLFVDEQGRRVVMPSAYWHEVTRREP